MQSARVGRAGRGVLRIAIPLLVWLVPAAALAAAPADGRLLRPAAVAARPGLSDGAPDLAVRLDGETGGDRVGEPAAISPALAGFLSAVVPGAGQLVQGKHRGWFYMGLEAASWFGVWALRGAGNQAEDDFRAFADDHWTWDRYRSSTDCGEGLGPRDFEEEQSLLENLFDNSRDDFYGEIGDLDVYACGWDTQGNRGHFDSMRNRSNDLFRSARLLTTVAFLNHIVSAVDAAKSASNRRAREQRAFDWQVRPGHGGLLVRMQQRF